MTAYVMHVQSPFICASQHSVLEMYLRVIEQIVGLQAEVPEAAVPSVEGLGGLHLQPNYGIATRSMLLCRVSLGA